MTLTDDDGLATFLSVRARLVRVASRMLGSAAAAEDVVQDAWIRWQATNRVAVRDATAFLTTTVVRLAINVRQSAHARRETRAAPWLAEPIDAGSDQTVRAERADALTLAVSVLLERLSPAERAAYILREAFDYAYREIASVLGVQEANARQLVSRARLRLTQGHRTPVLAEDRCQLLAALGACAQAGDARALAALCARPQATRLIQDGSPARDVLPRGRSKTAASVEDDRFRLQSGGEWSAPTS